MATLLWDTHAMLIGERIRAIREAKNLIQGDIYKRSGLRAAYVSRVEHGHRTPSVETLEKFAHALGVPLYQFFYEGKQRPLPPHLPNGKAAPEITWGTTRKEIHFSRELGGLLARMRESDRRLLLHMARKMAKR
jgi:transcriptional regulator with XRE-family HTH domain